MSVKEINEKYRCNVCGNEVMITKVGGGTLVCCGEEMELIGSKEKSIIEGGFEVDDEEEGEEMEEYEKEEKEEEEE